MNSFLLSAIAFLTAPGGDDFNSLSDVIKELIGQMWVPCIAVASALTVIWGVFLGIKFWTAGGDEQKKKSAKSAVISFVAGIVIIFIIAVGAPMLIGALSTWMGDNSASLINNLLLCCF